MVWQEIIIKEKPYRKDLKSLNDEDLILISDLDEIPNLEALDFENIKKTIFLFSNKKCFITNLICFTKISLGLGKRR